MPTTLPYIPGSLNVRHSLGEVETCSIRVNDKDSLYTITEDQPFILELGSTRVFGGNVLSVDMVVHSGSNNKLDMPADPSSRSFATFSVNCQGYTRIAHRQPTGEQKWADGGVLAPLYLTTPLNYLLGLLAADGVTGSYPGIGNPPVPMREFQTRGDSVGSALNRLKDFATQYTGVQWYWRINAFKVLEFYPITQVGAGAAIFQARADQTRLRRTRENYANRIILNVDRYIGDMVSEGYSGNGSSRTVTVNHPLAGPPRITVNGEVQNVGTDGIDNVDASTGQEISNGADWWYFNYNSSVIKQDSAGTILTSNDEFGIDYMPESQASITVSDTAAIAQRAAISGDSGVTTAIIDLRDAANAADIRQIAMGELWRRNGISYQLRLQVPSTYLYSPGQQVMVVLPGYGNRNSVARNPLMGYFFLRGLRIFDEQSGPGCGLIWQELDLVAGPITYSGVEFIKGLTGSR